MNLRELVERLRAIRDAEGDIPVTCYPFDGHMPYFAVTPHYHATPTDTAGPHWTVVYIERRNLGYQSWRTAIVKDKATGHREERITIAEGFGPEQKTTVGKFLDEVVPLWNRHGDVEVRCYGYFQKFCDSLDTVDVHTTHTEFGEVRRYVKLDSG